MNKINHFEKKNQTYELYTKNYEITRVFVELVDTVQHTNVRMKLIC